MNEQIERFIGHVGRYLTWRNVEQITAETLKGMRELRGPGFDPEKTHDPEWEGTVRSLMEASETTSQAGADIRRDGPPLAEALEAAGHDSTDVLRLVHCADGGGGPAAVSELWDDLKVGLERVAIRPVDAEVDELVTLSQVEPLTGLKKRTLEGYLQRGKIPKPDCPGGGGKAHKWYWRNLRPALAEASNRPLPKDFPFDPFRSERVAPSTAN